MKLAGTVYIGCTDFTMTAISDAGKVLWSYSAQDQIASSPAIGVNENGGSLIFGSNGP